MSKSAIESRAGGASRGGRGGTRSRAGGRSRGGNSRGTGSRGTGSRGAGGSCRLDGGWRVMSRAGGG